MYTTHLHIQYTDMTIVYMTTVIYVIVNYKYENL